ncbi:MAG: hypothetical protein KKG47_06405 [Proteobacteria bacterium]|nr:hypothetical protein [Pseudomonadota bacterium]MBU1739796.1 hypothetical protein [Pseudomonadota bacterium]
MDMDNLIILFKNIYYRHTWLVMAVVAGLAVSMYVKPKAVLKTVGVLLAAALILYTFSALGKSSSTGMSNKKQMINQTVEKFE